MTETRLPQALARMRSKGWTKGYGSPIDGPTCVGIHLGKVWDGSLQVNSDIGFLQQAGEALGYEPRLYIWINDHRIRDQAEAEQWYEKAIALAQEEGATCEDWFPSPA